MQRRKWTLILILVALAIVLYLLNNRPEWLPFLPVATQEITVETDQVVFSSVDGSVSAIQIESKDGKVVMINRGEDGLWVVEKPLSASADQGLAEAAAIQASAIKVLKTLENDPGENGTGLGKPNFTISVTFKNGNIGHLIVGDQTPIATGYYARRDNGKVIIISSSAIEALLSMLNTPPIATPTVP
jgi:hypothetical protein